MIKILPRYLILIVLLVLIFRIVLWGISPNRSPSWTGFGEKELIENHQYAKTLWDWLELALIPFILALSVWYLGKIEKNIDEQRDFEKNQETNINNYLESMTKLLLENNLKSASRNDEVQIVARTKTLMMLQKADKNRKALIIQFLFESGLIDTEPIVDLNGADISESDLNGIILREANIKGAYFNNSKLIGSKLDGANLSSSNFNGSNISNSTFENTNLTYANFVNAVVKNCDLTKANLDGTDFSNANLKGSRITKEQADQIIKINTKNLNIL